MTSNFPESVPKIRQLSEEDRPKAHKFKIQVYDFSCGELPQFEKSELFLNIDFGGYKMFKTAIAEDTTTPEWGFRAGFQYHITYLEKLKSQRLNIQCFNKNLSNLVGEASIDLHTIACGPSYFKLSLETAGSREKRGTLNFRCVMKMMTEDLAIVLNDVNIRMMGVKSAARIDVSCSLNDDITVAMPHNVDGHWPDSYTLRIIETSLSDLLKSSTKEHLHFAVIDSEGMKQGEAELPFRQVTNTISQIHDTHVPFSIDVSYSYHSTTEVEDQQFFGRIGELKGNVSFQNLPPYAQMVGGLCEDGQISHSPFILAKGLPYPSQMETHPPVWQDPANDDRTDIDNIINDLKQDLQRYEEGHDDDNEEHQDAECDDEALHAALEKIDVPPPWEKRRERVNDRPSNRMYFVDPRSRRTTYKDPRFVPDNWDQRIDPSTGKVYFHYHKNRGSTFLDPRGCPKDWDMRLSKDSKVYFAYMPAMKTTWTDPRGLEENWEACLDDQGRMYFKDSEEKTTTWQDPRLDQNEVVRTKWRQEQMQRWLKEQVLLELQKINLEETENNLEGDENDDGRNGH